MTTESKFVSIEKGNAGTNLCFWADKEKTDLEAFKVCKNPEEAEASLKYWTSEGKTLITTTSLETALLNKLVEGMDTPGEGWFHEFTEDCNPTCSERAVLGSLIKKGLVCSDDHDGESWLTLSQ